MMKRRSFLRTGLSAVAGSFIFSEGRESFRLDSGPFEFNVNPVTNVPGTNNEWILCDTYPQGTGRLQELYLYHIKSDRKIVLGNFSSPSDYKGEWRCDLHPKCIPDGKTVIFDSTHTGKGRQIYSVDISEALINK